MKKESLFAYVLRLTLTLLTIAAVVAAIMAAVNRITKPLIDQATAEKTQKAIQLVLPGGYKEEITQFTDETGLVSRIYKGESGYAVEVVPMGFDSTITMMVGVDNEGKVLGISVVSHNESAGMGAVAAATNSAGNAFRNQFVGQTGPVAVKKDGGTMEIITSATITSRAVCTGVNAALACVAGLG